jgi:hypothetical protein
MGNHHFDGELWTLDLARAGRMSAPRILDFLLSNLDFTRIRRVQAHDFGSFLMAWEHSNPTITKLLEEFNWKCHMARE